MKSIAVIAIGSRIMKDDGIGVWVAEAIESTLNKKNIDVIIAETDFEFGIYAAKVYDYMFVLDAMVTGNMSGKITVFALSDAKVQKRYASQHDMSLIDMLVRDVNPPGSLIGIEADEVDFGFGLSHTLQEKFEKICGDVLAEILKIKEGLTDA
ncbi:MAG: hydrogenase maturation protease [Christensenellales bacterium]|jgi:hydrogenase maturation protease